MMVLTRTLLLLACVLLPLRATAENWPQFRGAQAGVAPDDPRLPEKWSATDNVAWKLDIPGRSWSSPVVWADHVFVLTAINTKQPVQPLNAVGTYLARSLGGPMTGRRYSKRSLTLKRVVRCEMPDARCATGAVLVTILVARRSAAALVPNVIRVK